LGNVCVGAGLMCQAGVHIIQENVAIILEKKCGEWDCRQIILQSEKEGLKLNNVKNENLHGYKESLAMMRKIVRLIGKGVFLVRSIELRKEMLGRGWRVVIYLNENPKVKEA